MSEMVERVAKALCRHYVTKAKAEGYWDNHSIEGYVALTWLQWVPEARAAIEAQGEPLGWRPMSENPFPWEHENVLVMAFAKDDPTEREIFRCVVADHGQYYPQSEKPGIRLSLHEEGWIPYAWRDDDTPERDDEKFPPLWEDQE